MPAITGVRDADVQGDKFFRFLWERTIAEAVRLKFLDLVKGADAAQEQLRVVLTGTARCPEAAGRQAKIQ